MRRVTGHYGGRISVIENEEYRGGAGMALPATKTGSAITPGIEGERARVRRLRGIRWSYSLTSWLGLLPFLLFYLIFEILPAVVILQGSFLTDGGALTLNNYQRVVALPSNLNA